MNRSTDQSTLGHIAAGAVIVVLFAHAALPLHAQSPSLGELAKQERERRQGVNAAGKVFSDKDLPKPPQPAGQPGAAPLPLPTVGAAQKAEAPKPDQKNEKDEPWWRGRMTQARETLRRGEVFAEALQSRINALSADAANRDDPYQRAKAVQDRQQAIAELARVTSEIDQGKKDIAAIEEEARQSGTPPGWLR
jgi:type IV secretory pathway VirB10-like protein